MRISRSIAKLVLCSPLPSTKAKGLRRTVAVTALALFLCFGEVSDLKGQLPSELPCGGDCKGGVVPAVIGVGVGLAAAGIIIAVNHNRHTLKGCVSSGQNGLELQTSDKTTYLLEGNSADINVGDRVKLSGSRKKAKDHRSSFIVNGVIEDYGPCTVKLASNAGP